MVEVVRSIRLRVEVDTNKGTYKLDEQCDGVFDAEEKLHQWVEEISL